MIHRSKAIDASGVMSKIRKKRVIAEIRTFAGKTRMVMVVKNQEKTCDRGDSRVKRVNGIKKQAFFFQKCSKWSETHPNKNF